MAPSVAQTAPPSPHALPAWLRHMTAGMADESPMDYLARHSHSFRYAARFLPKPYDTLVAEVYAFCRFTDDMVDRDTTSSPDELRARLQDWRRLARAAHAGTPSGFALLDKPLLEMGRRGISFDYASDLIDGVAMDLPETGGAASERRYATLDELDAYSYRVASVVGLWLTRLVGVHDAAVLERAAALGHAMQLTNILRDVGEDWRNGRLYLPLDVLARHGIPEEDIGAAAAGGPLPRGWDAAMEELMAAADVRYARALSAVKALPAFFRVPVAVSGYVYRDIHTALRGHGYNNFTRRAHTSKLRKLWLGVKARLWLVTGAKAAHENVPAEKPRRPLVSLLASILTSAAFAASPSVPAIPDLEALAATARIEVASADSALRAAQLSRHLSVHLRKLRALHTLSVHDAARLPDARAALAAAESLAASSSSTSARAAAPVLLAYRGAYDVVEARHATWPTTRLIALRRGLNRLNDAVGQAPADVDIRYLRLTSTWYLPALLRPDARVEEDFMALAELLPAARREYPAHWYLPVADFVLKNGPLTPDARQRLMAARAQAASPRG